jgi:hypothetical protein
MGLTALKLASLSDKEFDNLYSSHQALWLAKAKEAYKYVDGLLKATGQPVRRDDVLVALEPAVEIAAEFRSHMESKRLTQKYWKTYFSEYIIDMVWGQLP